MMLVASPGQVNRSYQSCLLENTPALWLTLEMRSRNAIRCLCCLRFAVPMLWLRALLDGYQPLSSCLRRKTWLVKCQVSSPRQWFGIPTGRETEQGFQKGEVVIVQSASVICWFWQNCLASYYRQKETWRALIYTICSTAAHSEYFGNSKYLFPRPACNLAS